MNHFLSIIIAAAHAQELIPCPDGSMADSSVGCVNTPEAILSTQSDLLSIILKIADGIVTLAVSIAILVIVYGGIVYAISLGSEERIGRAKNILFWSMFGLMVSLLAKYIVSAILVIITQ